MCLIVNQPSEQIIETWTGFRLAKKTWSLNNCCRFCARNNAFCSGKIPSKDVVAVHQSEKGRAGKKIALRKSHTQDMHV